MALVAYGSSDESDVASDNEDSVPQTTLVGKLDSRKDGSTSFSAQADENEEAELPKPSQKEQELAQMASREKPATKLPELSQLVVKEKGKVRISIPRFSDFDDDDKDSSTKRTLTKTPVANGSRSALFSVLPTPKSSAGKEAPAPKTAAPAKPVERKPSKPLIPQSVLKPKEKPKEVEEPDEEPASFFSLDEPEVKAETHLETCVVSAVNTLNPENPAESQWVTNASYNLATVAESFYQQPQQTDRVDDDNLDIDEEALQFLQGKKRKLPQEIEDRLIDVRAEKLAYDPNMSQLKQVSEERASSKDKGPAFNPLQKRKHQITYLAAQAKSRELELKNQWAQNRMTRKQTQGKYGF